MKPDRNDRKFSFRGTPRTAGFHSQSYTSTTEDDIFWFTKLQMECFKAFPTNFLKPNAIVDLIDVPGRILKLNSLKAEEYCGDHLFAKRRIDP